MPEAELQGLDAELRSVSQGLATYEAEFDHLAELNGKLADEVVQQGARAGVRRLPHRERVIDGLARRMPWKRSDAGIRRPAVAAWIRLVVRMTAEGRNAAA